MASRVTPMQHSNVRMASDDQKLQAAGLAAALVLAGAQSANAGPFTRSDIASLTYEQIKGTGLANTCPKVEQGGGASISLSGGKTYKIDEFCLEPTSFQVLEEKLTKSGIVTEAVNTKVTTRQTYVLTGIEGDLVTKDGKLSFIEKDGIDYAPTTVQLPASSRCRPTVLGCSLILRAAEPSLATTRLLLCLRSKLAVTTVCSTRTTRSSMLARVRLS